MTMLPIYLQLLASAAGILSIGAYAMSVVNVVDVQNHRLAAAWTGLAVRACLWSLGLQLLERAAS